MNFISKDELSLLLKFEKTPCISFYLPTHGVGAEVKQNRIRFKNLIRDAQTKLIARGTREVEARDLLKPVVLLLNDEVFWQHQCEALALFLSPGMNRYYCLPAQSKEMVIVGDHFYFKPLFEFVTQDGKFYVLALSQNHLRFLQGTRNGLTEVALKDVPRNLADSMKYNDPERQLQFHTQTPRIPGARAAAIFHGHGVGIDDKQMHLFEYCHQIDQGLHKILKNEQGPLILAAVEPLQAIYRKMNSYSHLLEKGIAGNPDLLSARAIQERAWVIARSHFDTARSDALTRYTELRGTAQVSSKIEEILPAAHRGKVESLFLEADAELWGKYVPQTGTLEAHDELQPDDAELLNQAAIQTFLYGGTVWILERAPEMTLASAIYRHSLA